MKWAFLTGCLISGIFFILTIISVHFSRYDGKMYGIKDSRKTKAVSVLSVISGCVASSALVLLSIMDTYRYHEPHATLLLLYFGGLGMCSISTTWVYFDQVWNVSPYRRLRF
jgi:Frag1/DRAM/Sfk1 family